MAANSVGYRGIWFSAGVRSEVSRLSGPSVETRRGSDRQCERVDPAGRALVIFGRYSQRLRTAVHRKSNRIRDTNTKAAERRRPGENSSNGESASRQIGVRVAD